MKILVFTDIHGVFTILKKIARKSQKADLLICCGDVSNFGRNLNKIFLFLKKLNKPLLIIHGNHETYENIDEFSKMYDYIINLHNKTYSIDNYEFFGWGGGGFSRKDEKLDKINNKTKFNKKLIFISHSVPYKTKLDALNHDHVGSISIRKFIEKQKPILNFCGHLHENEARRDKINNTLIINPGPYGKIINLK
ncbi:MAG: metallophosphoesterase [Candidatus Woesearchaeota archaeon]